MWSWISLVDYAKDNRLALLSDDIGLRSLARQQGVATFGSGALVEALEERGEVDADKRVTMFHWWRREFSSTCRGCNRLRT